MPYAKLSNGDMAEIREQFKSYPPEIKRLIVDFDRLCTDWFKALSVIRRHQLLTELKKESTPDWLARKHVYNK